MSYFDGPNKGYGWAAGHFLKDDELCVRQSAIISSSHSQAVTRGSRKVVPAGAVIPANGSSAVGILYEDIDVTEGSKMGSIVVEGTVYEDKLPAAIEASAESAMTGITVVTTSPSVTRPDWFKKAQTALTVTSTEGAASGKTVIAVTGVTLETGEKLYYSAGSTLPDIPAFGQPLPASGWTEFDSGDSLTITDGYKVGVIAVTANGYVFGSGSATADTKA